MPRIRRRGGQKLAMCRLAIWWAPIIAIALSIFVAPDEAEAYPWLVRHGYTNCGACHADPSGGELLTMYGHAMSAEVLSTRWGGGESSSAAMERRLGRAVARAAHAKSAPKAKPKAKRKAAAKDELDDEELVDEGDDSELEDDLDLEDEDLDLEEEDGLDAAGETSAPTEAEEESAFAGMGALTGPLLGLGPVTETFLIGGSLRLATLYSPGDEEEAFKFFPMQLDVYAQMRIAGSFRVGASVGAVKVPAGSPHGRPAQITANQGDGYNLISRTHWIGYDFGDGAHTVRAGRLNLPFGIRMAEHVMWVRERTQTDRESDQQHGVALYMGFEDVRFELMGILGNYQVNPDAYRERGYAAYLEYAVTQKTLLGLSSMYTFAADDRLEPSGLKTMRQAHGPFLRASPSEAVAILLEADVLLRSRRDIGYVGFLQIDVEPARGFHLIATGEILDGGYSELARNGNIGRAAGFGRPLPGGWLSLQWFFLPHFDLRVDAIIRQEKQILSQLHVYL